MTQSLNDRLMQYIVANVDRGLLMSIEESIRLAYSKADNIVRNELKNTSRTRPRAQMRRYLIDDALAGSSARTSDTEPKGEKYIVIQAGNVTLSHIELHENKWARPAKHRTLLALGNAILEPETLDMFKEQPPKPEDTLHVVVVVLHPKSCADNQSEPSAILVSVPYTDWRGYHLEIPLELLLEKYGLENEGKEEVVDQAYPTLRADLLIEEDKTNRKSS